MFFKAVLRPELDNTKLKPAHKQAHKIYNKSLNVYTNEGQFKYCWTNIRILF